MPFQTTPKHDDYSPVAVATMVNKAAGKKKKLLSLIREYRRAEGSHSAVRVFKEIKKVLATL